MLKTGRNIFVRAALLVCVLMQLAAMLPHHHHEGGEAVCVDYFCTGQGDDCGECSSFSSCGSCGAHDCGSASGHHDEGHHGTGHHGSDHAPALCSAHTIVIAQPERESMVVAAGAEDIGDDFGNTCAIAAERLMAARVTGLLNLKLEVRPDAKPIHIRYISIARPSRAPDAVV